MSIRNIYKYLLVSIILFVGFFTFVPSAHAATLYWYGGTGTWSDYTNHWSNNSGNSPSSPASAAPTSTDDVKFDANSFTAGSKTVTAAAAANARDMDWTGATNNPVLNTSGTQSLNIYGSITLVSGMSVNWSGNWQLLATTTGKTITTNGVSVGAALLANGTGGGWTFQDNYTGWSIRWTKGTLNFNNKTFNFTASGASIFLGESTTPSGVTLNMGSSTFTGGGIGVAFSTTGTTISANTATINITGTGAISGGGVNFNGASFNLNGTAHTISGSNTFGTLTLQADTTQTITFTDGTTQTITTPVFTGSVGKVKTLQGSSTGGWNIVKAGGGTVALDYMSISYSTASPTNTWSAGTHSTNGGNNTGWIFDALQIIAGKGQDAYQLQIDGSQNITGYISGSASSSTQVTKAWHHVVMTYDGANIKIYVDGVLKVTTAKTGAIATNATNFKMGNSVPGKLDNVRVYNRALSATEVTAAYESYNPGIQVSNLQKGLVGQWNFNGNAKDVTPNRNHGTVTGATFTTDRKGQANKAYSFEGDGDATPVPGDPDYIEVANNSSLQLTGNFSVSVWVKILGDGSTSDGATTRSIIDKDHNYIISYDTNTDKISIAFYNGTAWQSQPSTSSISNDTWYHVVAVWTDASANLALYVNGASAGSKTATGEPQTNNENLNMGRNRYGNRFLNGDIDDVRIYNRALTTTEITALYQEYDPGIQVSNLQKGLVGNWSLDGDAKDRTPYRNHGTVTGATLTTDRKGQANKAYSFNGTTDYITVADNAALNFTTAITQTAWVKGAAQSTKVISRKGDTGLNTRSYGMLTGLASAGGTDKFRVVLSEDGSFDTDVKDYKTSVTAFDNTWHFVAYTFSSNTLKMYVDGVEDTNPTKTTDSNIGSLYQTSVSLVSGAQMSNGVASDFFTGSIDDVRIYNRALSSTEVQQLYESY